MIKYEKSFKLKVGEDIQNGDDSLTILPTHFLYQFNTRNEITCAAGTKKESIVVYEIPGHTDGLSVRHTANSCT
jgi:hypothetical protein